MKFFRSRTGILLLGLLVLLALFLFRPGASRLKARVVASISLSLDRPVEIAAVHFRLLPQPGFDLDNFIVYDNPAYSAEPMLRASEVTAALRVRSLLRGKLEIARLDLTEPSLNLVRNSEGHWNLENLLERAAKTPVAPTSKPSTEPRPGFPYIGADNGRINFKFGHEKKAYALTDADFNLWQESENSWGMRLKAQPTRTDYSLSDTGILQVNGLWQRSDRLRDTPLQFNLQWERGQLGQLTKLLYGKDRGWRGGVEWSASVSGTPADLRIQTSAAIDDFRRYDIASGGSLRLAAQCRGRFSSVDHSVSDIACSAPVGDGSLRLEGNLSATTSLALLVQDVPMQAVTAFIQRGKENLPEDLTASGTLQGKFLYQPDRPGSGPAAWQGSGEIAKLRLASKANNTDFAVERIPLLLTSPKAASPSKRKPAIRQFLAAPEGMHLEIGPTSLALGRTTPAALQGWLSPSSYDFELQGDTQIRRLLQLARMTGIPVSQALLDSLGPEGTAKINLRTTGQWKGLAAPQAVGSAELRSVRAEVRGMSVPVEVAAANLVLSPEGISAQNISATTGGTTWRGSLYLPRGCVPGNGCRVSFDLQADEISTERFNQLLNPNTRSRPWYRFLSNSPGSPWLTALRAHGKLTVNRVIIAKLTATRASADVELDRGVLRISGLHADVLGGRHEGSWTLDFTGKAPSYKGEGSFDHVALARLADLMRDGWVNGTASATYQASAIGWSTTELFNSADAVLQVKLENGAFPHIVLANGAGGLRASRFVGKVALRNSRLEFSESKLDMASGIYQVSGVASLGRTLNVKLTRDGAHGYEITGPLNAPRVARIEPPEARAALKP